MEPKVGMPIQYLPQGLYPPLGPMPWKGAVVLKVVNATTVNLKWNDDDSTAETYVASATLATPGADIGHWRFIS